MQRPKIIAIVGPTASGKTSLGIYLAKKLGGEIISADSRQVYKGLNIGTGKVTKKEMGGVPHYLLDICSPKKIYTASDFKRDGEKALAKIVAKQKISTPAHVPIIVGGTGLYIDVLLGRIVLPDVPPNQALREKLEKKSVETLFAMLQKKDPARAATIEPKNKRRLIRAIEIAEGLGASPSKYPKKEEQKYSVLWLGINLPEKKLHQNIHIRLLARMKAGMAREAKKLHTRPPIGISLSYKRMEELGLEYRSLARLLQNKITKEEFLDELERAIGQYAKRQTRWFGSNKDIVWLTSAPSTVAGKKEALKLAQEFLKRPN